MKKIKIIAMLFLFVPAMISAQPLQKRQYDIAKEKVLYTIGYAHLDTEWNWDYPTTINQYIKNTMEDNFKLFEKYPDYVFNFTGSRRYNMMKEYYPESYKKVMDYIKQGRWFVSGSSVDEGEVNISSSESVLRQVLYGNLFFKREFNKQSVDYMLPDCFGFVATMPSVWGHAGLLGFSTQKLTWRSTNGVPFNVGVWEGPDGKSIIASLNATDYTGRVVSRLDKDSTWNARLQDNINRYGLLFDYRYYGVGDVGGAPRDADVKNAVGSLPQSDSKFKVVLTSSDQIYKDITPGIRSKLPTFSGDLLLIEHSAGSMTSETYMKRANRKNEALAKSSEQLASFADWLGGAAYPFRKLNNSWDLVLGSQFHDILPGTSIPKAYEYAWNDEFIAMNGFSEVVKNSVSSIARQMNTQTDGRAVMVYNPVATEREDIVTAELLYPKLPAGLKVTDKDGNVVPSQILSAGGNKVTIIFLAKLPSVSLSVFDVSETPVNQSSSDLKVTENTLENKYYKLKIDANGDISGIYDKRTSKEVLSKPASLQFQREAPASWPSWNMDWNDRKNPPVDYMNKDVTVKIAERGPVRVALEVTRKGRNSEITQIISLASGEAGNVIEVKNKIDWQSKEVSLKAAFPTNAANEFATYSLNTAAIKRTTNNEVKFEVPGRQWIDITDRSNSYGVSILEDCKYGSDKPDNSTLRLTLMYTPKASSYEYQGTQDWGIHEFKYGIYPHVNDWVYARTPWFGYFLNNPLLAFETGKHPGNLGKEVSIIKASTGQVDIMAFKKAEESNYYIVRVNELYGKDVKNVSVRLPGKIVDAYEVNGQEQKIGAADFSGGTLNFDMTRFLIRSFAVKLENPTTASSKPAQAFVELPFNEDGISSDKNRKDGNIINNLTIPAELLPDTFESEDISFKTGDKADGKLNMISAKGQRIKLPAGEFNKVYILCAATEDTKGNFRAGNQTIPLNIQSWTGFVGQHYNRVLYFNNLKVASVTSAFTKRDNIAWYASHRHTPEANDAYVYSYLYKYEINIPKGTGSIVLPDNSKIKVFAITAADNQNDNISPLQLLYDDFSNNKPVQLRVKEYVTPDLKPADFVQKPLFVNYDDRMVSRIKSYLISNKLDTILVKTPPSSTDYADMSSGNKVTVTYYATGKSKNGKDYKNEKIDISNILDSKNGKLRDTVLFDNGEGRIVVDLQKSVPVEKINMYIDQFRNRGSQIFSIWTSESSSDFTGDPKDKGWKIAGVYGLQSRAPGSSGTSYVFNNLTCRYIMLITDGGWHGTEYIKQLDLTTRIR
jgi:alpha-mannosidase